MNLLKYPYIALKYVDVLCYESILLDVSGDHLEMSSEQIFRTNALRRQIVAKLEFSKRKESETKFFDKLP